MGDEAICCDEMLPDVAIANGTPEGAGAIGTNLVICGIVIGDCMVDNAGIL